MPLSRHFYSLDEVQSALYYTTSRNNPQETLFWCQELILSGCISEAISTLFDSWLWNKGPFYLQWFIHAWNKLASHELSEHDIILSTYQLVTSTQNDNSLWNILVLNTSSPNKIPDRITRKTPKNLPSDDKKEIYFVRALFQRKAQSAWWCSHYIQSERVWELLEWYAKVICPTYYDSYHICFEALQHYDQLLGYRSDEYDIIVRCLAILSLCLSEEKQKQTFAPLPSQLNTHYQQIMEQQAYHVGRKQYRIYTIPSACLYGTTLRGCSKWSQQNINQLYHVEKYMIGCPFWDEVLSEYAIITEKQEVEWKSDEQMEEFYNTYFPDDIPDEWTKLDKMKSHGDGILGPKDQPQLLKYSRNYLSKYTRLAWNTTTLTHRYLEKIDMINECHPSSILKQFHLQQREPLNESLLQPVHKKLII
jgi:hypothetical protein